MVGRPPYHWFASVGRRVVLAVADDAETVDPDREAGVLAVAGAIADDAASTEAMVEGASESAGVIAVVAGAIADGAAAAELTDITAG